MISLSPSPELEERSSDLVNAVFAGDPRAIARMLSRAEKKAENVRAELDAIYRHTGRAHVVGITGVPGCGKSTLVAKLAAKFRKTGHTVGIVAVDPSSPFSGGSVLGDRVRMADIALDPGVFLRSLASRGSNGGISRSTYDAIDILDAGGYEIVIVETVGVGQDAVDVMRTAHTIVVVSPPGLGDEIQASKAGLLEVADIHAVSKADKPEAFKIAHELEGMLHLSHGLSQSVAMWQVPVIKTSAIEDVGIDKLVEAISAHLGHLVESGEKLLRDQRIREQKMLVAVNQLITDEVNRLRSDQSDILLKRLANGAISPDAAAWELLSKLLIKPCEFKTDD